MYEQIPLSSLANICSFPLTDFPHASADGESSEADNCMGRAAVLLQLAQRMGEQEDHDPH